MCFRGKLLAQGIREGQGWSEVATGMQLIALHITGSILAKTLSNVRNSTYNCEVHSVELKHLHIRWPRMELQNLQNLP